MTAQEYSRGGRTLTGRVVSNKMEKTITVEVSRTVMHKTYRKYITRKKTYKVHDEENSCSVNDVVIIKECRPLSRTKRWMLVERKS